jgi:hypothetical protein
MDKTEQQRLELLRKISVNNRPINGSRIRNPSNQGSGMPKNSQGDNKQSEQSNTTQPGCNVCSRKKRS